MGALWNMGLFDYHSDDANTYVVGLSNLVATAAGFSSSAGVIQNFPKTWRMRKAYGVNNVNAHAHVPVPSLGSTLWGPTPGTFSLHSSTYTVEGRVGERRIVRI